MKMGDLVVLVSGGPVMTHGGESMSGNVICYWFEGPIRRCEEFPAEVLREPTPDERARMK